MSAPQVAAPLFRDLLESWSNYSSYRANATSSHTDATGISSWLDDSAAAALPSSLIENRTVADFAALKEVGAGANSTVYHALCRRSGLPVALKRYRKIKLSKLNVRQVQREIIIHSSLDHPHIVDFYAAFEDADYVYLVMEYASGGDLFDQLKRCQGRMIEPHVLSNVMLPFLSALNYLHERGIVHRDIKPENIVFAAPGGRHLKITDFGLAINVTEERPVTRLGTLDYMAPEVLCCQDKHAPDEGKDRVGYGSAVDCWACGILAYELIVGRPPFAMSTRELTIQSIMATGVQFPRWMSPSARAFISQCLHKTGLQRYTVREMLAHPWIAGPGRQSFLSEKASAAAIARWPAAAAASGWHKAAAAVAEMTAGIRSAPATPHRTAQKMQGDAQATSSRGPGTAVAPRAETFRLDGNAEVLTLDDLENLEEANLVSGCLAAPLQMLGGYLGDTKHLLGKCFREQPSQRPHSTEAPRRASPSAQLSPRARNGPSRCHSARSFASDAHLSRMDELRSLTSVAKRKTPEVGTDDEVDLRISLFANANRPMSTGRGAAIRPSLMAQLQPEPSRLKRVNSLPMWQDFCPSPGMPGSRSSHVAPPAKNGSDGQPSAAWTRRQLHYDGQCDSSAIARALEQFAAQGLPAMEAHLAPQNPADEPSDGGWGSSDDGSDVDCDAEDAGAPSSPAPGDTMQHAGEPGPRRTGLVSVGSALSSTSGGCPMESLLTTGQVDGPEERAAGADARGRGPEPMTAQLNWQQPGPGWHGQGAVATQQPAAPPSSVLELLQQFLVTQGHTLRQGQQPQGGGAHAAAAPQVADLLRHAAGAGASQSAQQHPNVDVATLEMLLRHFQSLLPNASGVPQQQQPPTMPLGSPQHMPSMSRPPLPAGGHHMLPTITTGSPLNPAHHTLPFPAPLDMSTGHHVVPITSPGNPLSRPALQLDLTCLSGGGRAMSLSPSALGPPMPLDNSGFASMDSDMVSTASGSFQNPPPMGPPSFSMEPVASALASWRPPSRTASPSPLSRSSSARMTAAPVLSPLGRRPPVQRSLFQHEVSEEAQGMQIGEEDEQFRASS